MATVCIWKIKNDLRQVIKYTTNKEKTDISKVTNLDSSLEYFKNDFETEEKIFVSGINCEPNQAFKEMIDIKKKYMKTDGILGFHAYQSFKAGEVTPEEAHQIGVELAKEMWGDKYQVVVSTHFNTKHYHNHFVINSVSFVDGKKYYNNRTTYAELRRLNDCICKEHGKSYLEEKKTKAGINYVNYQKKNLSSNSYYKRAKEDLDFAISQANDYQEFLKIMKNIGYEVSNRSGKLSIKHEEFNRNIRIERYFGEDYSIINIQNQIKNMYLPINYNYTKNRNPSLDIMKEIFHPKYNTFRGMYIRYCKLLNIYPNLVKKYYVSQNIRDDVRIMDLYSKQAILLTTNSINTEKDFIAFSDSKVQELINLKNKREDMWKLTKKVNEEQKNYIIKEIYNLTNKINSLNDEVKLCESIRAKKDIIKENLENIKGKELNYNEYIK